MQMNCELRVTMRRTVLEQVRSGRADQQERHARGVLRDVFDQVEER